MIIYLEQQAVEKSIADIERGDTGAALKLLQQTLSRRKAPDDGQPDTRSTDIMRVRAYIEQAIVELQHCQMAFALRTLRLALAVKKYPAN